VGCRHTWGEHRVYFHDEHGRICSLPATWTNVVTPEPFVELSAGRSLFRIEDLLALAALLRELAERNGRDASDTMGPETEGGAESVK